MIQLNEFQFVIPLVIVTCAAIVTLMIEVFTKNRDIVFGFSLISVVAAFVFSIKDIKVSTIIFNEFINVNNISTGFNILILTGMIITFFASRTYLIKEGINFGEFYSLMLFSLVGMMLMVMANDILIIFLGLETMSICFYVLAGFMRKRLKSNESALKYFLLGAFMTGFLLYGIALIYGSTGTTNLMIIFGNPQFVSDPMFMIGMGLFIIGFFFKLGVFPFHMWIPDVYDGAPTIVSGMMSTSGKIAAAGAIFPVIIALNLMDFRIVIAIAAILTMLFGNIIAIAQTNVKRLLAYSSIASAGYLLVGLAAMNDLALKGIMFYLIAYVFMQLGAFIVVSVIEKSSFDNKDFANISLEDYKGLAKRNPALASFLTLFLFSLAGMPPFAGFWGKYYLFFAAIKANLIGLSIVGILLSVVGVYYYLKLIVYMWFSEPEREIEYKLSPLGATAIVISVAGTIFFGLYPELFFDLLKLY